MAKKSSLWKFLERVIPMSSFQGAVVVEQREGAWRKENPTEVAEGRWQTKRKGGVSRSTWRDGNCKLDRWMKWGKEKIAVWMNWLNTDMEEESLPFPGESSLRGPRLLTCTKSRWVHFSCIGCLSRMLWYNTEPVDQRQRELSFNPDVVQSTLTSNWMILAELQIEEFSSP